MQLLIFILISIYSGFVFLWDLIVPFTPLDASVILMEQNIVVWLDLLALLGAFVWSGRRRRSGEAQENAADVWGGKAEPVILGLLCANLIYCGGGMGIILALTIWLIALSFYGAGWLLEKKALSAFLALMAALEVYSVVLLLIEMDYVSMGQPLISSFWLDIVFVAAVVLYECGGKAQKLAAGWLGKRKKPGRKARYAIVALMLVLGIAVPFLGYKLYVKYEVRVQNPVVTEAYDTVDGEEFVRALRSPNIQLLLGSYTVEFSYSCEEDQYYEIIWLDGSEEPPVIVSGELPSGNDRISVDLNVTAKMKNGYFCIYLLYNGNGALEAGEAELSLNGSTAALVGADEFTAPNLIGYEGGNIEGLNCLYATYIFADMPKNAHLQLVSTEFDPENYAYRISRLSASGETELLYASDAEKAYSTIGYTIQQTDIVVEVYRKTNDGTSVAMQVNNVEYINRIRKMVMAMMAICTAAALVHLGLLLMKERKVRKSDDGETV